MSARFPLRSGAVARHLRTGATLLLPLLLAGCNFVVMHPAGDVALQQRNLVVISTALMLLIILPVIALTLFFAWRYRESNRAAVYDPDWHHSSQLEVIIWTAPLVIIVALGALTWIGTHTLDPYRSLTRIGPKQPVAAQEKAMTVEVVALDWKWLFFYPEQGIATVNELAAPLDKPIQFKITASSVMNAFYVPALAGMIYAMPGMQTQLHAVINKEGVYDGLSSNYSGSGFSRMNFKFHGLPPQQFEEWVAKVKSQGSELSRDKYLQLDRPSEKVPVTYYSSVAPGLYDLIVNMCADPGKMCAHEMMAIDAKGGAGVESQENRERLQYDDRHLKRGDEPPAATSPASNRPAMGDVQPQGMQPRPEAPTSRPPEPENPHAGHSMPGMNHQTAPAPADH